MSTDRRVVYRTLSQEDFDCFAEFSGDYNPIHVSPEFAAGTHFGRTVAHGMLVYSILDDVAKTLLPNAIALSQNLTFPAPAFADEPLSFSACVEQRFTAHAKLTLQCIAPERAITTCVGDAIYITHSADA